MTKTRINVACERYRASGVPPNRLRVSHESRSHENETGSIDEKRNDVRLPASHNAAVATTVVQEKTKREKLEEMMAGNGEVLKVTIVSIDNSTRLML